MEGIVRIDFVNPLIGVSFLLLFLIGAFISYNFYSYSKNILLANLSNRALGEKNRDESNTNRKAGYWLNSFFLLVASMLLYKAISLVPDLPFNMEDGGKLGASFGLVLLIFGVKYSIKKFIGIVFKKEELTNLYFNQIGIKDKAYGIIVFPFLLCYSFSLPLKDFALYSILGFTAIYLLLRWVSGVLIGIKHGNLPYFYSILYICTLEILPIALAIKVFSTPILSALA